MKLAKVKMILNTSVQGCPPTWWGTYGPDRLWTVPCGYSCTLTPRRARVPGWVDYNKHRKTVSIEIPVVVQVGIAHGILLSLQSKKVVFFRSFVATKLYLASVCLLCPQILAALHYLTHPTSLALSPAPACLAPDSPSTVS